MSTKPYQNLAPYYDRFMDHVEYNSEAEEIYKFLFETGLTHGSVLDLGAGSGGHLLPLLNLDIKVDALDISEEMLDLLKEKISGGFPSCELIKADMSDFSSDKSYDVIYSLGDTIHHLCDADAVKGFLSSSFAALKPGGYLIFSWKEPEYFDALMEFGDFYEEHGEDYLLWHTEENPDADGYLIKYTAMIKDGDVYRCIKEEHPLLDINEDMLSELRETIGFVLREDYSELVFGRSLNQEYKRITVLEKL